MGVFTLLRALFKRPRRPLPSALPELVTEYRLDSLPLDDIARYRSAFGFSGEQVPLTWWYLLAQRAHLATMLEPAFPFRIVGLVHMDNALEEIGTAVPGQPLLIRTVLRVLPPSSSGALRCVLETTGTADGVPVFSCASTYLIRRGSRGGTKPAEPEVTSPGTLIAQWTLDTAAGRRYARLSGDWNPIHLAGWSARLMGMRAPIIHGMHTLGACCASFERTEDRSVVRLACSFRRPITLGSTVQCIRIGENTFVVRASGNLVITGSLLLYTRAY
ncbi:hypothetical protein LK542_10555 [Massilia sp. IC2-477]|uniref:MaoC family dehydratase n=1 Tax=Massilia sp. IC2-477 TaxID=2887198 RepID=UPI001D12D243|nr:MaoC/PaaZ C-terminal domain-containing protein [Massilia sp. IC2-477]MCC2956054.1 hypothetical protein [Massilia sp. IC2-477]